MDSVRLILEQLGASRVHQDIYIALCSYPQGLSVLGLSRILGTIPRSTLQGYVEEMRILGLVHRIIKKQGSIYHVATYHNLLNIIQQRHDRINQTKILLEQHKESFALMQFCGQTDNAIKTYEGKEAIELIYQRLESFHSACATIDLEACATYLGRNTERIIESAGSKAGQHVRECLIDNSIARLYAQHIHNPDHHIHFLDPQQSDKIHSDNILVDGVYYHISYQHHPYCIQINNPILYQYQLFLFEQLREHSQ